MRAAVRATSREICSARGAGSANFAGTSATSLPHPTSRTKHPENLGRSSAEGRNALQKARCATPFRQCYTPIDTVGHSVTGKAR
jgi:hypothetical protein